MSRTGSYWIFLTNTHISETYIHSEEQNYQYAIAPEMNLKKGDTVYLWWTVDKCFYGWGVIVEHPRDFFDEVAGKKRKRLLITVKREKGFNPRITAMMMLSDNRLRKLIPTGFDDLYAIPLRPGQAAQLNDYIRERNLEAPQGSVTTNWLIQEDSPQITIQALLSFGEKSKEGQLVQAVRLPWFEIIKKFQHDPDEIYKVDPRKFEEIIAGAYEREGYEVILTPHSNDKGRDVIATKPGIGSIRIFDRVKRYKISRPVTREEVMALLGELNSHANVSKGIITTTSTFAPRLLDDAAVQRFIPFRLELRPRAQLLSWLAGLSID